MDHGSWREERDMILVSVIVVTLYRDMNCTYVTQEDLVDKSLIMITAFVYCVSFRRAPVTMI